MAAEGRRTGSTLADTLEEEAYRFEFFQAVRLLERLAPGRAPVGRHDAPPGAEAVRFRTRPTLLFPASEVYEVARPAEGDGPPEMSVAFMGLTGPSGVLPSHTTELVAERARARDYALWEFLDLFSHRMVSLFYRAWERYRFTVAFERGKHDELTDDLFAVVGLGTRGLRDRLGLPDHALIFYGGRVAQRPHSADAVAAVLGDYFGVPARLEPFTGQWLELDDESLTRLGSANSRLGESTVAGARVWDAQSKFRVWFGPLALAQFERLLPRRPAGERSAADVESAGDVESAEGERGPGEVESPDYRAAVSLGRLMAGAELDFDFKLILKAAEVPDCVLGKGGETRPRLGWTTWLKTRPFEADDSQVLLRGAA